MKPFVRSIGEFYAIDLHNNIFQRHNVNDLRNSINELVERDVQNILLNFTALENIDTVGLGVLLAVQKIALIHNLKIRLYGLRPNILHIIKQTQLNRVLDLCSQEEEVCFSEQNEEALIA